MKHFAPLTTTEQLARFLRDEILARRLAGEMPGISQLAGNLGVSSRTVIAAVSALETDGFLIRQGAGRRSRIIVPATSASRSLRIALLPYEKSDAQSYYRVDLRHQLLEAGHAAQFITTTLTGLRMDVGRVARLVERTEADAWIVFSASREVLEWFAGREKPALAFAGRRRGVDIASAGPDKPSAVRSIVRHLIGLGHRRIVYLVREERRKPLPGLSEQAFLDELEANGVTTSSYNLPDWVGTTAGLHASIKSLYAITPPTAMLIDEMPLFHAVQSHLARRNILAPEHVSLICTDPDPSFEWSQPTVAHISWDPVPMIRRIVRWANRIANGQTDKSASFSKAKYVDGGTVGRVRR